MTPLITFDLTQLPTDTHIVGATLSLWALARTNANPAAVGVYRLNRPWSANTVTWQLAAAEQPWSTPGANAIPADRDAQPLDLQQVDAIQDWYNWNITELVQFWIRTPEQNHGIILKAFEPPKVYYAFAAADYHTITAHPKLTLHYWIPPSTSSSEPW